MSNIIPYAGAAVNKNLPGTGEYENAPGHQEPGDIGERALLLGGVLIAFDHLLDHLAAYGACLSGSEVTVVAVVLQRNAHFVGRLHLDIV